MGKLIGRRKISDKTEAEIMFKSDLRCCICQGIGDHIHHLDEDVSNNDAENLALLCYEHHNKASLKGGLSRKLSKATIIKFREAHYKNIEKKRMQSVLNVTNSISKLTSEDLLQAAKDAILLLELEEIKEAYFNSTWNERIAVVERLNKFAQHGSYRTAYEVLSFLSSAAGQTRGGMPIDLAEKIAFLTVYFLPLPYTNVRKKEEFEIGTICMNIGLGLAYDGAIKLRKLSILQYGLWLWKHVFVRAKKTKNTKLEKEVIQYYENFGSTLERPERSDLDNALELVLIFRKDLATSQLTLPIYTKQLDEIIDKEN